MRSSTRNSLLLATLPPWHWGFWSSDPNTPAQPFLLAAYIQLLHLKETHRQEMMGKSKKDETRQQNIYLQLGHKMNPNLHQWPTFRLSGILVFMLHWGPSDRWPNVLLAWCRRHFNTARDVRTRTIECVEALCISTWWKCTKCMFTW